MFCEADLPVRITALLSCPDSPPLVSPIGHSDDRFVGGSEQAAFGWKIWLVAARENHSLERRQI